VIGGSHRIRRIGYGRTHEWPSVRRAKPLWVLECTARCSMECPKGAAVRDGLADGEVSQRKDHTCHCEVCGFL
jgi:hypothetical protein